MAVLLGGSCISAQAAQVPLPATVPAGRTAILSVTADGTKPFTYQWRKNTAPISGATQESLTLSGLGSTDAGTYDVMVSNSAGSVISDNAVVLSIDTSASQFAGRLINLSILTSLATVGDSFTMGYVVGGSGTSGTKPLVIRAAGPSLVAFDVPNTLADPKFELFTRSVKTSENDNWGGSATLASAMAAVGAFAFSGAASLDAAAALSVASGDNSVKVSAVSTGTGNVIAEVYDATPPGSFTNTTPRLLNVSVLKEVGLGFTVGFVVGGNGRRNVLVRAIGPTLAGFGVSGVLSNPQLTLNSGQTEMASNDDWGGGSALVSAFSSVAAFVLPATSSDAALVVGLNPGAYTVQVSGVGSATGIVLVEVYELP